MRQWRYWNSNGFGVAVVGVVTMCPPREGKGPDEPFDWSAYIGATGRDTIHEKDTVDFVDRKGCKLSKKVACAFFPQFAEIPYRY